MIRGIKRPVEKRSTINADLRASIHNKFVLEVVDSRTGKSKEKAVGYNVICNQLWTVLLTESSTAYFQAIHYGSGSGTPSAADTQLFTFVGAKSVATTNNQVTNIVTPSVKNDYEHGVYSITQKIVLDTSDAVGVTISEVGIGYSTNQSSLCTHAMLEDMNGNPISITKTDTDVINIYATIFIKYDPTGANGVHICPPPDYVSASSNTRYGTDGLFGWIAGLYASSHSFERKYPKYAMLQNNMVSLKGFKRGSSYYTGVSSALSASFDASNRKLVLTASRFIPGENNQPGGYKYVGIYSTGEKNVDSYQTYGGSVWPDIFLEAGPGNALSGSEISGEAIGTGDGSTMDFKTKFPCVYDCTVLVDGSPATGVTVESKNHILSGNGYVTNDIVRIQPESTPENILLCNDPNTCSIYESLIVGTFDYYNSLYVYFSRRDSAQPSPGLIYLYNKNYAEGLGKININSGNNGNPHVYLSDDMVTWVEIASNTDIPEEYHHYRFIKLSTTYSNSSLSCPNIFGIKRPTSFSPYNIHFDTPPADGAVITANYKTPVIAKDENHVFDLTVTIQLGEYTE